MRPSRSARSLLLAFVLSLVACTAPESTPDAPGEAADTPAVSATPTTPPASPGTPAATSAPAPAPKVPASEVAVETASQVNPGFDPMNPDRSCRTDADCTVKDVGSCCGTHPMCVHKDAHVDPKAVQAQCAKDGMSSICGFREVGGCSCVQGQCQDIADGGAVM